MPCSRLFCGPYPKKGRRPTRRSDAHSSLRTTRVLWHRCLQAELHALQTGYDDAGQALAAETDAAIIEELQIAMQELHVNIELLKSELASVSKRATGCTEAALEPKARLQCTCGVDPEPVKTEPWSFATVCPTCFATAQGNRTGVMSARQVGVVYSNLGLCHLSRHQSIWTSLRGHPLSIGGGIRLLPPTFSFFSQHTWTS